jgi:hypothetical protein
MNEPTRRWIWTVIVTWAIVLVALAASLRQ